MRLQEGPGLRGWFKRKTEAKPASPAKGTTAPLQARPVEAACPIGDVPIGTLRARDLASVAGRVEDVAAREGRTASVEAELSDGTGQVVLVWMGRRRIVGLEAGAGLTARGRVARLGDGRLAIYNPTYELRP